MASVASTTPSTRSSAYVDVGLELQPGSRTPESSASQNTILLTFRDLQHSLNIRSTHERLLQNFANQFPAHLESLQDHALPSSDAGLVAAFLQYLATSPRIDEGGQVLECVTLVLECFEEDFLANDSIQTLALRLPGSDSQRRQLLNAVKIARSATHAVHENARKPAALFDDDANTSIHAIFGGPSDVTAMLASLRRLWDVYDDVVPALVRTASDTLTTCLSSSGPWVQKRYRKGLDIAAWLSQPESMPSPQLFQSAPVSLPIGGLFQVVNFAIACYELDLSPQELLERLDGISGYSAGIVAATVLATTSEFASLDRAVSQAVQILFELGSASEELCQTSISDMTPAAAMVRVVDCPQAELDRQLLMLNKSLETSLHVHHAIKNGPQDVTVAGPSQSIKALYTRLDKLRAPSHLDQSKTPANMRKPDIGLHEVPISVPLHTAHLREAISPASTRLQDIALPPSSLHVAVFDSRTGQDMRTVAGDSLLPTLLQIVLSESNDWEAATQLDRATHVLDFGPGGADGAGSIVHRNRDGTGLRVILASVDEDVRPWFGTRLDVSAQELATNADWSLTYAPALRKSQDGQLMLDNKMTRLLGLPPVMVAGMTPTTANWGLVSAITNAGYHAELAGGGFINKEGFDGAIQKLADSTPRGRGICINLIYGNPRQYRWQVIQIKKLLADGFPIDGVTFGAGVPSLDALQEFFDMRLKYLCFKPGSTASIDQVIEIANAVKTFPIMLQWTGGRAGGHHSYEDFHTPIIKCYSRIRACPNIVLVAGSGFGGSDDSYQYLTGEWSLRFQRARMPFDGILLGSRVMVAKEAKTSRAVKDVIVATPGLPNDEAWWQTYHAPAGGVVTVKSEMGEPIHKIATRGTMLWKELDQSVFGIADPTKRLAKLVEMKSGLIDRLNRDFQKVWFGQNVRGDPVDTEDMTYGEVLRRLVDLLYIRGEQRWIHTSHEKLVRDFVNRVYCRARASLKPIRGPLADPWTALPLILENVEDLRDEVLATRDALYFIMLCKRSGQKPPPFLVDMGADFETWFKKDSLWQSEDIAAVINQDPGRVCILQGPVAARHSIRADEPVRDILNGISTMYVASVLRDRYAGKAASIPIMKIASPCTSPDLLDQCASKYEGHQTSFKMSSDMTGADKEAILETIAGRPGTWLHAMIMCDQISQDRRTISNPIRRVVLASADFHVVKIEGEQPQEMKLIIQEGDPDDAEPRKSKQSLSLYYDNASIQAIFQTNENQARAPLTLTFEFSHHPETPLHPIWEESLATRNVRMADFYRRVWLEESPDKMPQMYQQVRHYVDSIQEDGYGDAYRGSGVSCERILPDFGMVLAWRSLLDAVLHPDIYGPCLDLVHLSNEFELLDSRSLSEQELTGLTSMVEILAVCNEPIGRLVRAKAILTISDVPIAHLVVEFLFRNYHEHANMSFEIVQEPQMATSITNRTEAVLLQARPWIVWTSSDTEILGKRLAFNLMTTKNFGSDLKDGRMRTAGSIVDEDGVEVGQVDYSKQGISINAVNDYLSRHGKPIKERHMLRTPQQLGTYTVTLPSSNVDYSRSSGDFNPIHTSSIFASYAGLPGTITHGMYISAAVRTKVEQAAGCSEAVRMRFYKVSFIGMALPNTVLEVRITHTDMQEGLRVLVFEARNKETNEMVVAGEARVDQASTAYVFTGQGSQKKGMGMDLRASCPIARNVWDRADAYYLETYGM